MKRFNFDGPFKCREIVYKPSIFEVFACCCVILSSIYGLISEFVPSILWEKIGYGLTLVLALSILTKAYYRWFFGPVEHYLLGTTFTKYLVHLITERVVIFGLLPVAIIFFLWCALSFGIPAFFCQYIGVEKTITVTGYKKTSGGFPFFPAPYIDTEYLNPSLSPGISITWSKFDSLPENSFKIKLFVRTSNIGTLVRNWEYVQDN